MVVDKIATPVLRLIPESVHPNSISIFNHLLVWTLALCAVLSPHLGASGQALALVAAGMLMFGSMLCDCLDGMQARRTGRCSKLGEMMDHWLDAIHVPLTSGPLAMALQLDPWALFAVHVSNCMVYNAQLVHYHHSRRFLTPPTSGVDAQFGVSFGYIGAAALFFLVPRTNYLVDMGLSVAGAVALFVQLKLAYFYYKKMDRQQLLAHLRFVLLCSAFAALYLTGAISALTFMLAVTFVSFRITGTYVLNTIVQRPFGGFDWGIAAFIVAIAGASLAIGGPMSIQGLRVAFLVEPISVGGYSLTLGAYVPYVPYLAFLYMVTRNLVDFSRHFSALRPGAAAAPAETEKLA
ncbi:MAG: CDP-alcohol phosphatidyltransferase family protein [Myxococcales bacterium]|nr:CDP-alcohol phosphatidyltransferase family protein [Myxococcales bacterium]